MTNTLNTLLPFPFQYSIQWLAFGQLLLVLMLRSWGKLSQLRVGISNYELIQYNCHTVGTTGICPKLHIEILLQCAENCIMYSFLLLHLLLLSLYL